MAVDTFYVYHLGLVRGKEVIVNSAGDIGPEGALSKPSALERSLPELPSLKEEDGFSVKAPAGAGNALSVHCEGGGVTAFHGDGEKVTDAAVFRNGSVAYAIEDGFSVRGKLGIGEAAKR